MENRELQKLKIDIFETFRLSDSSVKQEYLKEHELELIFDRFNKYTEKEIKEAINTKVDLYERKFLSQEIKLDAIKNEVFKNSKTLNNLNINKFKNKLKLENFEIKKLLKKYKYWFDENEIKIDMKSINEELSKKEKTEYDTKW